MEHVAFETSLEPPTKDRWVVEPCGGRRCTSLGVEAEKWVCPEKGESSGSWEHRTWVVGHRLGTRGK